MTATLTRGLALASLSVVAGCGTVARTAREGPAPYGGVRASLDSCEWAGDAASGVFWLLDVPLSACADTLMLPVTIPWAAAGGRVPPGGGHGIRSAAERAAEKPAGVVTVRPAS